MLTWHNKKYNIDKKSANETLQNVFAACDQTPNSKPLEVIRVQNMANTAIVKLGLSASMLLLAMVLLTPLAFKNSGDNKQINKTTIVDHYIDEDLRCFVMVLDGNSIDYDGIYAKRNDGATVVPFRIDRDNKKVMIPFSEGNLNIFIPNPDGTYVQAVLSR